MQQDNLIISVELCPDEPVYGGMNIRYYLQNGDYQGDAPHRGFGIEARLYDDGRLVDSCVVEDIAVKQAGVLELIELLSRNTVTPVTLRDVVEDYLSA